MKNQHIKKPSLLIFLTLLSVFFSCNFNFASHQFSLAIAVAQSNTKEEAERLKVEGEEQYNAGQLF